MPVPAVPARARHCGAAESSGALGAGGRRAFSSPLFTAWLKSGNEVPARSRPVPVAPSVYVRQVHESDTFAPQPARTRPGVSRRGVLALAAAAGAVTATDLALQPARRPPPPRRPDFGPNVLVFDPAPPAATIQASWTRRRAAARHEMGTGRFAFLFKPGATTSTPTRLLHHGRRPRPVPRRRRRSHGAVRVERPARPERPAGISALTNFWRSAENLAVTPTDWSNQWAVSQAAPLRRVHVKGILLLEPGSGGYSSGGYIADSKVDGITINGSQQQWLTRNSELGGSWTNGVWNQVFSGVDRRPRRRTSPNPPYTMLPTSPVTREKPFLYVDADGRYRVFVPRAAPRQRGHHLGRGRRRPGTSVPIEHFFVAKPPTRRRTINQALAQGKHLLLTPGVYQLDRHPAGHPARTPSCSASACPP